MAIKDTLSHEILISSVCFGGSKKQLCVQLRFFLYGNRDYFRQIGFAHNSTSINSTSNSTLSGIKVLTLAPHIMTYEHNL